MFFFCVQKIYSSEDALPHPVALRCRSTHYSAHWAVRRWRRVWLVWCTLRGILHQMRWRLVGIAVSFFRPIRWRWFFRFLLPMECCFILLALIACSILIRCMIAVKTVLSWTRKGFWGYLGQVLLLLRWSNIFDWLYGLGIWRSLWCRAIHLSSHGLCKFFILIWEAVEWFRFPHCCLV